VWRAAQRQRLRSKPLRERSRDLTGSLLLTAVIAPLLTLVFVLLEGRTLDGSVSGWSLFMWLALSSVLGSWLMLLMGKVWEGDEGDHFRRRLVMLVAGLVFGGAVFALGDYLVVKMPDWDPWAARAIAPAPLLRILDSTAAPAVLARYLLYFGGLFVILRWWSQADPLRRSRFSLWATGLCVLWAWIMTMLCSVPQPWGVILAATISAATQLSAPWADPKQAA
jgi:hypothetical protein